MQGTLFLAMKGAAQQAPMCGGGVLTQVEITHLPEESLLLTKVFIGRQNVSWLFPILSDYSLKFKIWSPLVHTACVYTL